MKRCVIVGGADINNYEYIHLQIPLRILQMRNQMRKALLIQTTAKTIAVEHIYSILTQKNSTTPPVAPYQV